MQNGQCRSPHAMVRLKTTSQYIFQHISRPKEYDPLNRNTIATYLEGAKSFRDHPEYKITQLTLKTSNAIENTIPQKPRAYPDQHPSR